jgi:hypothetical protein
MLYIDPSGFVEQSVDGASESTWNQDMGINWMLNDMKSQWLISGVSGRNYWAGKAEELRQQMRESGNFKESEIMQSFDDYVEVNLPYTFIEQTLDFITPYVENSPGGGIETGVVKGLAGFGFLRTIDGFGDEAQSLFKQLKKDGAKFSKADTIGIVKTSAGKIARLEKGSPSAGLLHIMLGHGGQFAKWGLTDGEEVSKFILETISTKAAKGAVKEGGQYFEVSINGETKYLNVVFGSNGFIVTAHPYSP